MTEELIKEEIKKFKASEVKNIKEVMIKQGGLNPVINLFTYNEQINEFGLVMLMIPEEVMRTEESKEVFAQMLPTVMEKVTEKGLTPLCFSWSSEAWIRKMPKDQMSEDEVPDNWRDLPKEEALITYFESEYESDLSCMLINRTGKAIDEEGNIIDTIELTEDPTISMNGGDISVGGRFTNLFKQFKKK